MIRKKSLPPLRYEGHYVKQYAQTVSNQPTEINLVLQKIPMPQYMLLQIFPQDYFTGAPSEDFLYDKLPSRALPFAITSTRIRYGNRDLSYQTANFDVDKQGSNYMRQDILKTSDVFGCLEMDPEYYAPASAYEVAQYQHPHFLFSFCSDEKNQITLRPMDYVDRPDVPNNLSLGLITDNREPFPSGKLLISLIYTKTGIDYLVKSGTFAERDLNSVMLVS